jgi:hypothetical protein
VPFLLILIGAVLLVSALRNTQGSLATALETDVPGFTKWGLALGAIAALGFIPGMQRISRWLLALVVVVLVLRNWSQFLTGITSLETPPTPAAAVTSPASAYVANPSSPNITAAEVSGSGTVGGSGVGGALASVITNPAVDSAVVGFGSSFV